MADLTDKQKAFVQEYLVDLNATQAAMRAGYSPKTAGKIGFQLLGKTRIQQAIQKAMDARATRTEITADKVLRELAKIGFSDMKDFLAYRTTLTRIGTDDDGQDIIDYATVIELKDSDLVDGTLIQEVKQTKDGVSFKLHNKMDALEKIGKHLKLFTDKVETEIGNKDGKPFEVRDTLNQLSVEDLRKLANLNNSG